MAETAAETAPQLRGAAIRAYNRGDMPAGPPCGSPFLRIDLDDASSIAIDGPAASGKTAVGIILAKRMGYRFLDTGAMYRAVTLAAVDRAVDLGDGEALGVLVSGLDVQVVPSEGGDRLLVSRRRRDGTGSGTGRLIAASRWWPAFPASGRPWSVCSGRSALPGAS